MHDFQISHLDKHEAQVRFEITSIISDQIAPHEVQLRLYHSHFETAEFSQYQHLFDQAANLLKSRLKQKVFFISFCTRNRSDAIKGKNGALFNSALFKT